MLAGSPLDANAHYTTAIELARLTGDVFWHAGALEGSVFALLVRKSLTLVNEKHVLPKIRTFQMHELVARYYG